MDGTEARVNFDAPIARDLQRSSSARRQASYPATTSHRALLNKIQTCA
jgi:hypothetical protein